MHYVAITLEIPHPQTHTPTQTFDDEERPQPIRLDLDIPWHMPIPYFLYQVLPEILRRERVPLSMPSPPFYLRLVRVWAGRTLPLLTHTFWGAGVRDGERLRLETYSLAWFPYRFYLHLSLSPNITPSSEAQGEERIYLAQRRILLGRHDWSKKAFVDVDLSHFPGGKRVSRKHAEILHVQGRFVLRDLGSRHGTWIHQSRITSSHTLLPGERILLGDKLSFSFQENPTPFQPMAHLLREEVL